MQCEILPVGLLQCNCCILWDDNTKSAVVIDPGDDVKTIEEVLRKNNLHVEAIFITHAHIDHIGGAHELKKLTGAPVYMNLEDEFLARALNLQASWLALPVFPETPEIDVSVRDGDRYRFGNAEITALHTPGHTPGSICLWLPSEKRLFAGDTLFQGSIGRTDLPGGDATKILRSIHEKLLVLPEDTLVIPGHGPATTIGQEKEMNPFLRFL